MSLTFRQAVPFRGPAYEYLREDDALPTYREIADQPDPLCQVKLFHPGSRWTYYVCAASGYDGIDGPLVTGYCVSALDERFDEFGDQDLVSIAEVRLLGLPPERDLHFRPRRVSEIRTHVTERGYGP